MRPGWLGAHRKEVEGGDQMKRTSYTKMQRCSVVYLEGLWLVPKGWERTSTKDVLGTKGGVLVRVKSRMKLASILGFVSASQVEENF